MKDIDKIVGSREKYGSILYSKFIVKDEPTNYFAKVIKNVLPNSLLSESPVSIAAIMSRIATVTMLSEGELNEDKKD